MNRTTLKRVLFALVVLASVAFLAHRAITSAEQIRGYAWRFEPGHLALALAMHVGVLVFGTIIWSRMVRCFDGPPVPVRTLLRIWSMASPGRYVPGVIWQFVLGQRIAEQYAVSPVRLLVSMAVQMGTSITSAALVATLMAAEERLISYAWPPVAALAGALAMHPRAIDGVRRLAEKIVRRGLPAYVGSWRNGLTFLVLSFTNWLFFGTALWVLLGGLIGEGGTSLPRVIGIHAFVFVAGYGAFFVPAGLGVREAALALLLGPEVGEGVAVALAAASRIWTMSAELGTLFVSLALLRPPPPSSPE